MSVDFADYKIKGYYRTAARRTQRKIKSITQSSQKTHIGTGALAPPFIENKYMKNHNCKIKSY